MGAVRMRVNGCTAVNGCCQNECLIKHHSASVNIRNKFNIETVKYEYSDTFSQLLWIHGFGFVSASDVN